MDHIHADTMYDSGAQTGHGKCEGALSSVRCARTRCPCPTRGRSAVANICGSRYLLIHRKRRRAVRGACPVQARQSQNRAYLHSRFFQERRRTRRARAHSSGGIVSECGCLPLRRGACGDGAAVMGGRHGGIRRPIGGAARSSLLLVNRRICAFS